MPAILLWAFCLLCVLTLNYIEMHVLDVNEIFGLTFYTCDRILEEGGKNGPDALTLYYKYIKQSRIQQTNQTKTLNIFLKNGLNWGDKRLKNAKEVLKKLGLIDDIIVRDELGKIVGHYVRVNYLINEQKVRSVGITYNLSTTYSEQGVAETTSGGMDTNALSNININALSNKKEKESEKNFGTTELGVRLKDYQLSPDIINLIQEFDKCKKGQKISKMSDTQLKKWVNKLKNLGLDNDEGMKRVIENSIVNGWQGIFELKGEDRKIAESSKEPKTDMDYIELYHKYYLEYKEKELKEKWGDDKYYEIRRLWLEWCASK